MVKSLAAENGDSSASMISRSLSLQHAIELVVEDVLADQPAPVISEPRHVLELTREQFVVLDVVAVLRLPELILQLGGVVFPQFTGHPVKQLPPLRLAWLRLLFLGRHPFGEKLLLGPVQKFQTVFQGKPDQVIQLNIALLGVGAMAIETIALQQLSSLRGNGKWRSLFCREGDARADEQKDD